MRNSEERKKYICYIERRVDRRARRARRAARRRSNRPLHFMARYWGTEADEEMGPKYTFFRKYFEIADEEIKIHKKKSVFL